MLLDYYAILGLSPSAMVDEIKHAYRVKAMQAHPDRGGSHDEMVLVNEAWSILSDPQRRAQYDQLRAAGQPASAVDDWNSQTEGVRRQAAQYPRTWKDFERWLGRVVANDVAAATYGSFKIGPITVPTGGNSVTAFASIVSGAGLALMLCWSVGLLGWIIDHVSRVTATGSRPTFHLHPATAMILVGGTIAGGAWLGALVHMGVREILAVNKARPGGPSAVDRPAPVGHTVFPCRACGQRLRVPLIAKRLALTCPKCKDRSEYVVD